MKLRQKVYHSLYLNMKVPSKNFLFNIIILLLCHSMNIEDDEETREAMRNLVLLVASLTFCGHTDLKLSATGSKYSS